MFSRLWTLFFIGLVVVFASLGYMIYQNFVELDELLLSTKGDIVAGKDTPEASDFKLFALAPSSQAEKFEVHPSPPDDRWEYAPKGWDPGIKGQKVKFLSMDKFEFRTIITPDGKTHQLPFPKGRKLPQGGYILEPRKTTRRSPTSSVMSNIQIPEGEDRDIYLMRRTLSKSLGISIEEVEAKMKRGELTFTKNSLVRMSREDWIKSVGGEQQAEALLKEVGLPDSAINATLRPPPVPVGSEPFIDDMPVIEASSGALGAKNSEIFPARSDVPRSPSNLSGVLESSRRSITGGEETETLTPPTTESIVTQFRERLSPERFDKAQKLIDQYGMEEGLRRLREMDPAAAQQFEQRTPVSPRKQGENRGRDAPDGDESER